MSALSHLLNITAQEGKAFHVAFFRQLDDRQNVVSIAPDTTVVWNGQPLAGPEPFRQMIARMPPTQHEVSSFNVHPLPNGNENALNMMIDTNGRCQFGHDKGSNIFAFSAVFVVRRAAQGSPLMLQTMSYRLVHKPEGATLEL